MLAYCLQLPKFEFSSDSVFSSLETDTPDAHHFIPVSHFTFHYKKSYTIDDHRKISELFTNKFGPIPFSSNFEGNVIVRLEFALWPFEKFEFIKDFVDLLFQGQLINLQDHQQLTQFFSAHHRQIQTHQLAINKKYKIKDENKLIEAIRANDIQKLNELLSDKNTNVNQRSTVGDTPLYHAVIMKNVLMVRALLAKGANPNLIDDFGTRALESACSPDQLEIAELLLQHGADPNCFWNKSAMHDAFWEENEKMIALLSSYGARIDLCDRYGRTPRQAMQIGTPTQVLEAMQAIAKQNYKPAQPYPPLFTNTLGHVTLDYAQRYFLFPLNYLLEGVALTPLQLMTGLQILIENDLNFSKLPKELNCFQELENYIQFDCPYCLPREQRAWIKAGLLNYLTRLQKEKNIEVCNAEWLEKFNIVIRDHIVNNPEKADASAPQVDLGKKPKLTHSQELVLALTQLHESLLRLSEQDWDRHTRIGKSPELISIIRSGLQNTAQSPHQQLTAIIHACRQRQTDDSGFASFFHHVIRGRDPITANLYRMISAIQLDDLDSILLLTSNINRVRENTFAEMPPAKSASCSSNQN